MTVDAYRCVFDDQLMKNKALMYHIAEIAMSESGPTRAFKAKAIIKRFVEMLNDSKFIP